MTRSFLSMAIVVAFTCSANTYAEFGTKEQVMQEALEKSEPAYIADLLKAMGEELEAFARAKKIASEAEKMALLQTLRIVTKPRPIAWSASRSAASKVAGNDAWDRAYTCGKGVAWAKACEVASSAFEKIEQRNFRLRDLGEAVFTAAKNAIGDEPGRIAETLAEEMAQIAFDRGVSKEQVAMVAYRVAEWSLLNYMLTNAATLLEICYCISLDKLQSSHSSWGEKQSEDFISHFAVLTPEQNNFVAPWLTLLRS